MNLQTEDPMEYFYDGKKNGTKVSTAFIKISALLSQVNDLRKSHVHINSNHYCSTK